MFSRDLIRRFGEAIGANARIRPCPLKVSRSCIRRNVDFLHDEVLDAIDLDLGPRPLAEQNAVTDLHIERNQLARLIAATGPDSDDFSLRGFFPCAVRDDDAAGALLFSVDALDDDAVVKRTKLHAVLLSN